MQEVAEKGCGNIAKKSVIKNVTDEQSASLQWINSVVGSIKELKNNDCSYSRWISVIENDQVVCIIF